ncbi:hypothetical protein RCH09_000992 [Actimicrobium sp. GrIS 1.19]|uniref:hypothetical protein n=1 Tax=Actimicrobium sp. GrIS 1.19 TaxID=3071708 RepID=UPI002DFCE184|nr:hypothetical protein [Actimicrobium sp. GrIS 1.19]
MMGIHMFRGMASFAIIAAFSVGTATAQQSTPPAEALAACKTVASDAACSFTGPKGEVNGTCRAPAVKPLACVPKDSPQKTGSMTPPPYH